MGDRDDIFDVRMHDGSRNFADLPQSASGERLRDHLACLEGVRVTHFVTDGFSEAWIDFKFWGHSFSVNNQFGEFWFFVDDPECYEEILRSVVAHCQKLLG